METRTDVDNWRMSRIEEELDKLDFSSADSVVNIAMPPAMEIHAGRAKSEDIYSKVVIKPKYQIPKTNEQRAVNYMTGKYDSLERVRTPMTRGVSVGGDFWSSVVAPSDSLQTAPPSHLSLNQSERRLSPGHSPRRLSAPLATTVRKRPKSMHKPITEQDIHQVEMFYRSHKTDVSVCQCIAHAYMGSVRTTEGSDSQPGADELGRWMYMNTGVPLVMLDTGESRRRRRLNIVLAERGTGFVLWRDCVTESTRYRAPRATFHVMHLSYDRRRVVGLQFDDTAAAADFLQRVTALTSDPRDEALGGKKKKKTNSVRKLKYKRPAKADISQPCCFTHLTSLNSTDGASLLSAPGPEVPITRRRTESR